MAAPRVSRRTVLKSSAVLPMADVTSQAGTRSYWVATLRKVADPVLTALSAGRLRNSMPIEAHSGVSDRARYTHLEAFGRLLCGMAPWLETQPEDRNEAVEQAKLATLARQALTQAVDPHSSDFMNFKEGRQPVVDAAFLALSILRAPNALWDKLDGTVKRNVVDAMRLSRVILPGFNNWLLFSATVEAFFAKAGESWDRMRVDYALRQHEAWYKGDGLYGDGPRFHWDYYNSFVIHPMLLAVTDAVGSNEPSWRALHPVFLERARRYAAIQERLIAPDGSFPAIGRSLAYRCGAFHLLADIASRKSLPEGITPGQARSALTAVINKTLEAPDTFDNSGWLKIGLCGHQPSLGEAYISTGSLYLCSAAFVPLGLKSSDPFWSEPDQPWTSKKVWSGQPVPIDHAIPN